ncbi:MAG: hypothetical protein ABSC23_14675 [Bryobacteraceae bacterium]
MSSYRLDALLVFGLLLSAHVWCADPPPEFTAAGVVRGANPTKILVPGVGMSIYGQHLGPSGSGCSGSADPQRRETPNPRRLDQRFVDTSIYPTELCGTQVFIGDQAAGLLYVSEKQINFKIPQDAPENGSADIRVVRMGQASLPVTMEAGFEKTTVSLEQPAYTGMPVWLKADLPLDEGTIRYPYVLGPAGFGCNEVEVRREGKLLAPQPGSDWMRYGGGFSGNACGSYSAVIPSRRVGRLPLHLLYRFDASGTYEVRLSVWDAPVGFGQRRELRARSEWTPIEVLPSKPNQRLEWLGALRARAPAEAAELLTDTLPSLLGVPDDASFEILAGYLYYPDASVQRYAMNGLSYWPEDAASEKLLRLFHAKGPSDSLIGFLTRQPGFRAAHSGEIVEASLPFLAVDSPVLLGGAVDALRLASPDNPAIRDAVLRSAEHVVSRADSQTGSDLAQMIAATKDDHAHAVLRTLLEEGYNQVAYALLSFRDPADLPGLCALLADPGGASLPEELYRSYGDAAVPYFERALSGAPGRFTAEHIARQLMAIGDPAGFQFAARSIEQKGVSRFDMIQTLKSQFPELSTANDDAIAAFARKRAGPAQ